MNRVSELELNPQMDGRNRLNPSVEALLPGSGSLDQSLHPTSAQWFSGSCGIWTHIQGISTSSYDIDIELGLQHWNSAAGITVLGQVLPTRSEPLNCAPSEWTAEKQEQLDDLIRKEALGSITESETADLEQLQVARDRAQLGSEIIDRMGKEQAALSDLVDAFERYVRATQSS